MTTMTAPTHTLPAPARSHSTCPWCHGRYDTIVELLDHVDQHHVNEVREAA
jgi:hypothetical protein